MKKIWKRLKEDGWDGPLDSKGLNSLGQTALMCAIEARFTTPDIKKIISLGVDPLVKDENEWNVLHYFVLAYDFLDYNEVCPYDQVSLFLKHGAFLDLQDFEGNSPLMIAIDHPQLVDIFLKHGANPFLINKEGDTALMMALDGGIKESRSKTIEILKPFYQKRELELTLPSFIHSQLKKSKKI